MKHYYQGIFGWFDFQDIYKEMVEQAEDGANFLEVGCFLGKSTSFMGVEIINSRKDIQLHVLDIFDEGNDYEWRLNKLGITSIKEEFMKNIDPVRSVVDVYEGDSILINNCWADKWFDFIFLDGDHSYDHLVIEVLTYASKVKKGGVIAGHDYYNFHKPDEDYEYVQRAIHRVFEGKMPIKTKGTSWIVKL